MENAIIAMPDHKVLKDRAALIVMIHADRNNMARGLGHRSDLTDWVLISVRRDRTSVARIIAMPDHKVLKDRAVLVAAIHADLNNMPRGLGHHSDLTDRVLISVRRDRTSVARITAMRDHKALRDHTPLDAAIHADRNNTPRGLGHRSDLTDRVLISVRRDRTSVDRITAMRDHKALRDRTDLDAAIHAGRNNMLRGLGHRLDLTVRVLISVRRDRTSVARSIAMPDHKVLKDRAALVVVIHAGRNNTLRGLDHRSDLTLRRLIDVTKDRSITLHRIGHRRVVRHMVGECMVSVRRDVVNSRAIIRVRAGRITPVRVPDRNSATSRLTVAVVPVGLEDTDLGCRVRRGLVEERRPVDQARVGLYRHSNVLRRTRSWGCLSMQTTTEKSARTRC